ncbi:hypothetical protein MF6394_05815 [Pseudomonas sp. MF6394]|nr:hypothetical protein MF6394_05815 [Pseudomonas sp. MF6394]
MLAKNVNDDAGCLAPCGVLRFFASKLAPTLRGGQVDRVGFIAGKPAPTVTAFQLGNTVNWGSWLACDSGVTGARFTPG